MISSFPKIFAIGTMYIRDIFNDDVVVEEKLDGSQISFSKINDQLYLRSKRAQLYVDNPEKMFLEGITYIDSISHKLPNNMIFRCEYLKKPKHNTLTYDRIPKNHLMLFNVQNMDQSASQNVEEWAEKLDIEPVPIFYSGKINHSEELKDFLNRDSFLGGSKIEGVVVKNYKNQFLLGGQTMPFMIGKYVSESFKEVHRDRWGTEENKKGRLDIFYDSFKTEARWRKAVEHLRDRNELENDPKDIGKLFKEIAEDIENEEKENIKEFLWNEFSRELKKRATMGMSQWYKDYLMNNSFEGE